MTSHKCHRPQDQLRQDYQFGEFLHANRIETRPLGALQDSERRRRLTDSEGHLTQHLQKQKSALCEPELGPSNSVNNLARTGSFLPTPSDPADFGVSHAEGSVSGHDTTGVSVVGHGIAGSSGANAGDDELIHPDLHPIGEHSEEHAPATIHMPDLQATQEFIDLLRSSVLEDTGMLAEDIDSLRNPEPGYEFVDSSPLLRSLRHFINNATASRSHYDKIWIIKWLHRPDDLIMSFNQVKHRVRWLSGVVPIEHDMCVNSCVAFTGPYRILEIVASVQLQFPEDDGWIEVIRRWADDLPAHVLGPAYWNTSPTDRHGGYRCVLGQKVFLLEFINDAWYLVEQHYDTDLGQHITRTRNSLRIDRENELNLGWWLPEDEANPERLPLPAAPIPIVIEEQQIAEEQLEYVDEDIILPDPPLPVPIVPDLPDPVEDLTAAFSRLTPIHVDLTLLEETIAPATVPIFPTYAAVVSGSRPQTHIPTPPAAPPPIVSMTAVPLTGALKGTPPTIFAGNRAESVQFLREFRQYRRLNRTHDLVLNPYSRITLACSLIRGPAVNDWVDMMERTTDADITRAVNPVAETDEALWTAFEVAFKAAWTDTLSKQNAYHQLTALVMSGDDIDGYIATFERLAHVAEWHRDASGTVDAFRRGLTDTILRACLQRTTIPETMTEWQTDARAEVQRARTVASCFATRGARMTRKPDPALYTHSVALPLPVPASNGVVPMDVDAITTTRPKYHGPLTDADRETCQKEGRCFRCRQQGHLSTNCPQKLRTTPTQINTILAAPTSTSPSPPQSSRIDAATVTTHILGLSSDERQHVISNLLLMSGSDLGSDGAAAHINALDFDFDPAFDVPDSPPPRPPLRPHSSYSPRFAPPPLPVVGDDNVLRKGVKSAISSPTPSIFRFPSPIDEPPRPDRRSITAPTVINTDKFDLTFYEAFYASHMDDNQLPEKFTAPAATSVSSPADHGNNEQASHDDVSAYPRSSYPPVFLQNAFERPRDPDEVTPTAPPVTTQERSRANAAGPTPRPPNTNPEATRNRDSQTHRTRPVLPSKTVSIAVRPTSNESRTDHVRAWLAQILYEPPPRLDSRPAPSTRDPVTDERADRVLRDYGYEYEDAQHEN
ncbi:hypothetical protein EDB85DRAFT_2146471 [Lactarius pseudohatsudake]|nr:hypothetical protein EDB85DRAFT_2146471 [Lactarius pseudohatsudake]